MQAQRNEKSEHIRLQMKQNEKKKWVLHIYSIPIEMVCRTYLYI